MKIDGPSKTSAPKGVSKPGAKKGAGDASFGGMINDTESASSAAPASGVMAITTIEAMLSVQEDGTSGGAKRSKDRATALLDELDKIRIGILNGSIPQSTLNRLSHMVSAQREKIMDPELTAVLDEIDLRVQVELAKLGRL